MAGSFVFAIWMVVVATAATAVAAQSVSWISSASGNWEDGSNWSGGMAPTAQSRVSIAVPGVNVTLHAATAVVSVQLSGALLVFAAPTIGLAVSDSFTINSPAAAAAVPVNSPAPLSGVLSANGAGSWLLAPTLEINIPGDVRFSNVAVNVSALLNVTLWSGGALNPTPGGNHIWLDGSAALTVVSPPQAQAAAGAIFVFTDNTPAVVPAPAGTGKEYVLSIDPLFQCTESGSLLAPCVAAGNASNPSIVGSGPASSVSVLDNSRVSVLGALRVNVPVFVSNAPIMAYSAPAYITAPVPTVALPTLSFGCGGLITNSGYANLNFGDTRVAVSAGVTGAPLFVSSPDGSSAAIWCRAPLLTVTYTDVAFWPVLTAGTNSGLWVLSPLAAARVQTAGIAAAVKFAAGSTMSGAQGTGFIHSIGGEIVIVEPNDLSHLNYFQIERAFPSQQHGGRLVLASETHGYDLPTVVLTGSGEVHCTAFMIVSCAALNTIGSASITAPHAPYGAQTAIVASTISMSMPLSSNVVTLLNVNVGTTTPSSASSVTLSSGFGTGAVYLNASSLKLGGTVSMTNSGGGGGKNEALTFYALDSQSFVTMQALTTVGWVRFLLPVSTITQLTVFPSPNAAHPVPQLEFGCSYAEPSPTQLTVPYGSTVTFLSIPSDAVPAAQCTYQYQIASASSSYTIGGELIVGGDTIAAAAIVTGAATVVCSNQMQNIDSNRTSAISIRRSGTFSVPTVIGLRSIASYRVYDGTLAFTLSQPDGLITVPYIGLFGPRSVWSLPPIQLPHAAVLRVLRLDVTSTNPYDTLTVTSATGQSGIIVHEMNVQFVSDYSLFTLDYVTLQVDLALVVVKPVIPGQTIAPSVIALSYNAAVGGPCGTTCSALISSGFAIWNDTTTNGSPVGAGISVQPAPGTAAASVSVVVSGDTVTTVVGAVNIETCYNLNALAYINLVPPYGSFTGNAALCNGPVASTAYPTANPGPAMSSSTGSNGGGGSSPLPPPLSTLGIVGVSIAAAAVFGIVAVVLYRRHKASVAAREPLLSADHTAVNPPVASDSASPAI